MSVSEPKYCGNSDTAGAYVLGALPDDEAYAFELHLAGCARCQRDIDQLSTAADALGTAVPTVPAPPELGDRIRAIVRAEAELLQAAGPAADRPVVKARGSRWGWMRPRFAAGGALAAGLACGLLVGAVVLGGSPASTRAISAQVLQPGVARAASATLNITGERGTLRVSNFPSPPAGRVYEVWELGAGKAPRPTDALFSVNSKGSGTVAVPGSLHGVREVLVTAEPLGGSQVPTRSPIVEASTAA
ncbi:MAG: anti-sigma factor [Actinomycetota bacterium]|nr:anti-sigma factor [Actinomycetota bacterium]